MSVYSIGLIAIDRYLYIVYGLQYQRYITPSRAKLLIAATWLIGKNAFPWALGPASRIVFVQTNRALISACPY